MISIPATSAWRQALTDRASKPVLLLRLDLSEGVVRMGSLPWDVVVDGHTWPVGDDLLDMSRPEPLEIDRPAAFIVVLADPRPAHDAGSWHARLSKGGYGKVSVEARIAFRRDGAVTSSERYFSGRVTALSRSSNPERGGWLAVEARGPLDESGPPVLMTAAAQKEQLSTDTSFDHVHEPRSIPWGRRE